MLKTKKTAFVLACCILPTMLLHYLLNLYDDRSEISNSSYKAISENLNFHEHSKSKVSVIIALDDGYISGEEFTTIAMNLMEENGVFHGVKPGADYAKAKQDLISMLGL
jgi:hypothetical protein